MSVDHGECVPVVTRLDVILPVVTEMHAVCSLAPAIVCLQHLAFVKSLERRVDGARFTLNRQLQSALAAALSARAWPAAGHCLRGFLELAEAGHAEEGLRQHLVGPLVRQVVTDVRQQQLQGGQAAGSSPLSQVVALSLSRLREEAGPLLAQLTAPGSGLGGIDLLGAVLLTELSTAVADGLPGESPFGKQLYWADRAMPYRLTPHYGMLCAATATCRLGRPITVMARSYTQTMTSIAFPVCAVLQVCFLLVTPPPSSPATWRVRPCWVSWRDWHLAGQQWSA